MPVLTINLFFYLIFLQTLYVRFVLGGNYLGMSANFRQIKIRSAIRSEKILTYLTCRIEWSFHTEVAGNCLLLLKYCIFD